jgi:CarD family transcriptional regulator
MPKTKKASAKSPAAKAAAARSAPKRNAKTAKTFAKGAKAAVKTRAKVAASTVSKARIAVKKPQASKIAVKASRKSVKIATKKAISVPATRPAAKKPVVAVKAAPTVVKPVAPKPEVAKMMAHVRASAKAAAAPAVAPKSVPAAVAKQAAQRISSPPITPKEQAAKALELQRHQQMAAAKKPVSVRHGFKTNEFIVYPAHGVGRIVGIEEQEIAGMALELFVITFEKDKMTLRVPTGKLQSVGMRKLADENIVKRAMETLKGRARIKRTMWSRRAQEYEAKINSGDLISIAEVVRDLYRSETQPEQSYSERQLYEAALDRMAREIAAVDKLDERGAVQRITEVLSKSAKGRRAAEEEAIAEAAEGGDEEVQAA